MLVPDFLKKVKELREITGVGFKDCKLAVDECNGDIEKSIVFLRKNGGDDRRLRPRQRGNVIRCGGTQGRDLNLLRNDLPQSDAAGCKKWGSLFGQYH